jgi:SAM-dependent methyltransferase
MRDYDIATYGDMFADLYDGFHPATAEVPAAVDFLADLARGGPVLELGMGTGRIALPLAATGLAVHGIESSKAMIDRLQAKPGAEKIVVSCGNFADVAAEAEYSLIFVTFNTFWMLLDQEEQIRCCANVARALRPDGVFVVEGTMPDPSVLAKSRSVEGTAMSATSVTLDVTLRDTVSQRIDRQQLIIDERGFRLHPLSFRYVWPSELDLMARLAGLSLRARHAGWRRERFGQGSRCHVSVYDLAGRGSDADRPDGSA